MTTPVRPKAVCWDCEHHFFANKHVSLRFNPEGWYNNMCSKSIVNPEDFDPVTGMAGVDKCEVCCEVNTDGNCKFFRAKCTAEPSFATGQRRMMWVELNKGDDEDRKAFAQAMRYWDLIVDAVVVSTSPGRAGFLRELQSLTKRPLIPGLRLVTMFPNMGHDVEGKVICDMNYVDLWANVADELRAIRLETGSDTILIEAEATVRGHTTGRVEIIPEIIRDGLGTFPKDIEYWWYPAARSAHDEWRFKQQHFCAMVAESLDRVRFVNSAMARHATLFHEFEEEDWRITEALADLPTIGHVHCYPDGTDEEFYRLAQIPGVLEHLFKGRDVMLYPGRGAVVDQGKALLELLERREGAA